MNFFDFLAGLGGSPGTNIRYGVFDSKENAPVEPDNLTVLYTCVKILSENFSRVPIVVKDETGKVISHRASDLWNHCPNNWMNPQTMRATSEWDRNIFGNSFLEITNNGLVYLPAKEISNYEIQNGKLKYMLTPISNPRIKDHRVSRDIDAKNLLHFRGVSSNGIFGLSPLSAAYSTHQLMQNATQTVSSFYKNNAMSTHAIERTIPAGGSYQNVIADRKLFQDQNAGTENAGNAIHLGLGEKIVPLAVKFADAELIKTLEFTRDTITSLYQVPNWMLSANDSTQDVEQQTSVFVSGTMANIANIYTNEIAFKMLSKEEVQKGYTIEFDLDVLKEVTFGDKVSALKDAVNNGLMTPNQANKKLGFEGVPGEFGGYHFTQAQMIPLERYSEFNQLLKDSPNVEKSLTDNQYKNE